MSFRETLLVIARRWRLSVPALLVAVALGVGVTFMVKPSYVSERQLLILSSPVTAGVDEPTNPFLNFGSTLVSTAGVIALAVSTPQEVKQLADQGATAEFEVAQDVDTPAPVMLVTATDHDPAVATRTAEAVTTRFEALLAQAQRQAGAPQKTFVRTSVLFSSPKPEVQRKAQIRAAIVVVVGFLTLFLIALFLLEGRAQRRSRAVLAAQVVPHWSAAEDARRFGPEPGVAPAQPASGYAQPAPDYQPSAPDYQPSAPDYQEYTEYPDYQEYPAGNQQAYAPAHAPQEQPEQYATQPHPILAQPQQSYSGSPEWSNGEVPVEAAGSANGTNGTNGSRQRFFDAPNNNSEH